MAASAQRKRTVLRSAKYRPVARILQHKDARITVAAWLREGQRDISTLRDRAEWFRAKLVTGDFEQHQNQSNADYIDSFADVCEVLDIPACEMVPAAARQTINLNGTTVFYNPDLNIRRTTRRNTVKTGGLFLRYAKGKEMDESAAIFQSAFTFGYLQNVPRDDDASPEKKLCMTVCAYSGKVTGAPTNSVYLFNEMSAACASIAEQWPNIAPPENAVL